MQAKARRWFQNAPPRAGHVFKKRPMMRRTMGLRQACALMRLPKKNEPARSDSRFYRISAWGDGLRLLLLLLPQRPALGRGHCWGICAALQLLALARSVRCLLLTLQRLIALEYFSQLDALFRTQHLQDARLP